jgi:hypothetical protein
MYIHVLSHINMYILCTNMSMQKVCVANVQCTDDGYIHFMNCTDIVELGTVYVH